ncbi:MAG: hypothetical protein U0841_10080 [Chloroflexia bacterium]
MAIRLYATPDLALVRRLRAEDIVRSVAFAPDGQLLATSTDTAGTLLWQVADGSLLRTISIPAQGATFAMIAWCSAKTVSG